MLPSYNQFSKDERVYPREGGASSSPPSFHLVVSDDVAIEMGSEKSNINTHFYRQSLIRNNRRAHLRRFIALVALASTILCFYCTNKQQKYTVPAILSSAISKPEWDTKAAGNVTLPHVFQAANQTFNQVNSTLGFQKIIAMNLPHRMDKKDELVNMGYASDLKIDFLSTRLGKDLQEIGLPHHVKFDGPGSMGGWRAHVDAWQKIVDERITTALILEDDSDWDVDVKEQLQRVHQPLATLINSMATDGKSRASTKDDPWLHQDWDVLMLGYCLETPFTANKHPKDIDLLHPPHILFDDNTLADRRDTGDIIAGYMDHYNYPLPGDQPQTIDNVTIPPRRLVTRAHGPICLSAYAVTLRGASKLLYHQTRDLKTTVDLTFAELVESGRLKGYEVMPPIMSQWKIQDAGLKNSDLAFADAQHRAGTFEEDLSVNHNPSIGASTHIRNSIRKNLQALLDGEEVHRNLI